MTGSPQRKRVLIVDDDPLCGRALRRILESDFEVVVETRADRALAVLGSGSVDALLSDVDMPGHDGLWLLEQSREIAGGALRVLVSGGNSERMAQAVEDGLAHQAFPKPVSQRVLLDWLLGSLAQR